MKSLFIQINAINFFRSDFDGDVFQTEDDQDDRKYLGPSE